jgi:hypothetical protein
LDISRVALEINNPNLKFIVACWPNVWGSAVRDGMFQASKCYRVPGSTNRYLDLGKLEHSEAKEVYVQYKSKYGFVGSSYDELPHDLKEAIRDPLNLKLLAWICRNTEIRLPRDNIVASYLQSLVKDHLLTSSDLDVLNNKVIPYFADKNKCVRFISITHLSESDKFSLEEMRSLKRLIKYGILECKATLNTTFEDADATLEGDVTFRHDRYQNYLIGKYIREHWE